MNEGNDNVQIRWYETEKEQYDQRSSSLIQIIHRRSLSGSANFTRRNLEDLNLETNIYLTASSDTRDYERCKILF